MDDENESGEVGTCVTGVDSSCNGDGEPEGTVESATKGSQSILDRLFGPLWTLF